MTDFVEAKVLSTSAWIWFWIVHLCVTLTWNVRPSESIDTWLMGKPVRFWYKLYAFLINAYRIQFRYAVLRGFFPCLPPLWTLVRILPQTGDLHVDWIFSPSLIAWVFPLFSWEIPPTFQKRKKNPLTFLQSSLHRYLQAYLSQCKALINADPLGFIPKK